MMDYIKSALEYTGLVAKPRQTSIGQALPHAVPATREEALENLMYIEEELKRGKDSITVHSSLLGQDSSVFQFVLENWTIPLVRMAILVLNEDNFVTVERSAYNVIVVINPYCERHWEFGTRLAGKEMRESKIRAQEATLELGRIIKNINPDVRVGDGSVKETARQLVQGLAGLRLS